MKKDSAVYENLYTELEDYEKKGVCILIDGNSASPMQVVRQHMVREAGSYMRDYEIDPEGHIESLATVYKGNIIKNLIMDCQSYTKYRPNETMGGIFVSWRRKEELPTGA